MKHIAFYGLQFGEDARELDPYTASENVHSLANDLGGFDHTAAIIEQMDVVLSIDTYIVHLAGAMNIPADYAALYPDWRWFLDRAILPGILVLDYFANTRLEIGLPLSTTSVLNLRF